MAEPDLAGRRILVVEDEYLLADELRAELVDAGAAVVGPVGTLAGALALAGEASRLDGAILDLNLGGKPAYPVADLLMERGVPLIFATGYDEASILPRFAHVPRCEKPVSLARVRRALSGVMA